VFHHVSIWLKLVKWVTTTPVSAELLTWY